MLEQHVNMQGDVLGILKEKLASMENTQIAILKELQTTNKWHKEADRWRRKAYELKKEKIDEMKKNNIRKNKQYIELLSLKSKKIDLELMKFNGTNSEKYTPTAIEKENVKTTVPRRESSTSSSTSSD